MRTIGSRKISGTIDDDASTSAQHQIPKARTASRQESSIYSGLIIVVAELYYLLHRILGQGAQTPHPQFGEAP